MSILDTIRPHFLKILLGLSTLGAAGTGGIAYNKGDSLEVKVAKVEERVIALKDDGGELQTHLKDHDKAMNRLDRRTTRMEVQQELMLDALKVPQSKRPEHLPSDE